MTEASEGETSDTNKLLLEALSARMERLMKTKLDAFRREIQTRQEPQEQTDEPRQKQRSPRRNSEPQELSHQGETNSYQSSTRSDQRRQRRAQEGRGYPRDELAGLKLKIPPFHGKNDPDAYLEWEKKIELVFNCQHYTELNRVRVAATEFYDYALSWWNQVVTTRRRIGDYPVETWLEMKTIMRRRFVPSNYHSELHQRLKRFTQGNHPMEKLQQNSDQKHNIMQQRSEQDTSPRRAKEQQRQASAKTDQKKSTQPELSSPLLEPQGKHTQAKSSDTLKLLEVICYECLNNGHYAKECPNKRITDHTSLELKKKSKSNGSDQNGSSTSIIHLSWSKEIGAGSDSGEEPLDMNLDKHKRVVEQEEELSLITDQSYLAEAYDQLALEPRAPSDSVSRRILITAESSPYILLGTNMSEIYNLIQYWQNSITGHSFKYSVFEFSTSSIMHLFCPMSAQKRTGAMERHKYLVEATSRRTPKQQTRGNYLDSQKRMKPNLLSIDTGQTVLRTKLVKKREYDADSKPSIYQGDFSFLQLALLISDYNQQQGKPLNLPPESWYTSSCFDAGDGKYKAKDQQGHHQSGGVPKEGHQTLHHKELELAKVSIYVLKDPFIPDSTDIIHLSLSKEPNTGFRAALKRTRRIQRREEDKRFKPPDLDQDKHQDARCFILTKEAPPDATYKPKPSLNRFGGITLFFHDFACSNLFYVADEIKVNSQVIVPIVIGKYEDEVLCDVLPMKAGHILLGRPWQSDRKVIHDGFNNKHTFEFNGRKTVLVHLSPKEVYEDQRRLKQKEESTTKQSNFFAKAGEVKKSLYSKQPVLLIVFKEALLSLTDFTPVLPSEMISVLQGYEDVFPKDKPEGIGVVLKQDKKPVVYLSEKLGGGLMEHFRIAKTPKVKQDRFHWPHLRKGRFSAKRKPKLLHEVFTKGFYHRTRKKVHLKRERVPAERKSKLMPKIEVPFKLTRRINYNAYQLDLQGKCKKSPSFNVSDLVPFPADETDLRSNLSQVGEDDMTMEPPAGAKEDQEQLVAEESLELGAKELGAKGEQEQLGAKELGAKEHLQVPIGPMTNQRQSNLFKLLEHYFIRLRVTLDEKLAQLLWL